MILKKIVYLGGALFLTIGLIACEQMAGKKTVALDSDSAKASYALGQQMGRGIKAQQMDVDVDVIAMAIRDVMDDKESRISQEEMRTAMGNMRQARMAKRQEEATTNKGKAAKFLEENKTKPNIKVTESGLQYEVVTAGEGKSPTDQDRVKVHYRGTLPDGTEFDSSYKRNQPAQFPVRGVIRGWTEALKLMKPKGKWKLYVPPELGYGERGTPRIPPNSVLIFDVELLEVMEVAAAPRPGMPSGAGQAKPTK